MHSNRALRIVVMFVAVALLALGFLVPAQRARADANAPNWSNGDFWLYVDSSNPNNTVRDEIVARENVQTLLGATYDAWHFRETTTAGSFAVTTDVWIRNADLGIVRSSVTAFGTTIITTYDPPQAQASFPLFSQKQWQDPLNVSVKVRNLNPTTSARIISYQVEGELDVSVPAGTFHSFVVRTLSTGAYAKLYYSDSPGYWTKRETWNGSNRTGELVLAQYRYAWGGWVLAGIGALIGVIALVVIAYLWKKRKQSMGQLGGVAGPRMAPPMQPPYGPQMPPQQPPQGPPPMGPP